MEKRIHLPVVSSKNELVALQPLALSSMPVLQGDTPTLDIRTLDLAKRTTLRTSSYTIYADLPDNSEDMLLVHGYTGAYDKVSRRVATYLRSLEAKRAPKPLYGEWSPEPEIDGEVVRPSDETIATLVKRGYLVTLTPKEEEAFFTRVTHRVHGASITRGPGYVIMPTYQCNLRCPYCFQDHMRTDPAYSHLLRVMDKTMVDRLLLGMRSIEAAHGITEDVEYMRSIHFFGGEPLLAASKPIVEYWIRHLKEMGPVDLSATTNATEIGSYRDLLGKDGIKMLQITLDGPKAEHDRRRIYADGSGSFELIADNIKMALDLGVAVSVRMNIDRGNIADLPELAQEFERRGWVEYRNFSAYVAAIHAGNENVNPREVFNSWQLGRALEELMEDHPSLAYFGTMDDSMRRRARAIFDQSGEGGPSARTAFCGAHTTMYILDAFADIYACWERTGDKDLRVGHITESGEVMMNRAMLEKWRNRSVVSNPVCRKCRYALSCGGGCAVLAEDASGGNSYKNHCDGFAKRFRSSVAEAFVEHASGTSRRANALRLCDV